MKIRPVHDRILVRREEKEAKTSGGIILTESAKEKPMQGDVVASGKGKILSDGSIRPLDVKVGDKVIFAKYSGTEVKFGGEKFLMMKEEDIMAILE